MHDASGDQEGHRVLNCRPKAKTRNCYGWTLQLRVFAFGRQHTSCTRSVTSYSRRHVNPNSSSYISIAPGQRMPTSGPGPARRTRVRLRVARAARPTKWLATGRRGGASWPVKDPSPPDPAATVPSQKKSSHHPGVKRGGPPPEDSWAVLLAFRGQHRDVGTKGPVSQGVTCRGSLVFSSQSWPIASRALDKLPWQRPDRDRLVRGADGEKVPTTDRQHGQSLSGRREGDENWSLGWSGSAQFLHEIGLNLSPNCHRCLDTTCEAARCPLCGEEVDTCRHILLTCAGLVGIRLPIPSVGNILPTTEEVRRGVVVAAFSVLQNR